jgi:GTPase SAR1 family protein
LKDLKANSSPDIKIFLVGNKADLEDQRVITTEKAKEFVNNYELDYFQESSAKTGMNVEAIFIQAAKVLYKDYLEYHDDNKKKKKKNDKKTLLTNNETDDEKKKGCC